MAECWVGWLMQKIIDLSINPYVHNVWNTTQSILKFTYFLLQGIFPTQGSNPGLLHGRHVFLPSEPPGKPRSWLMSASLSVLFLFCFLVHESDSVSRSVMSWTLCNPRDCSPPGSSVHGILQATTLEWIAISFSRVSSQPGFEPVSPALQVDSLPSEPSGNELLT